MAKSKTTKQPFAIRVTNEGCDDLEVWKLYHVLPDEAASKDEFSPRRG